MEHETALSIFISSPGDVQEEREAAGKVIDDVSRSLGSRLGISLRVRTWPQFRPTSDFRSYLNHELKTCALFLMIFGRTFGHSPTPNSRFKSGTEEEYRVAAELRAQSGYRPEIFTYFKRIVDQQVLQDPGEQLKRLLKFKGELQNTLHYKEYESAAAFPVAFKMHLLEWLLELHERIREGQLRQKHLKLQKLFSIYGDDPHTLIVYPPITPSALIHDETDPRIPPRATHSELSRGSGAASDSLNPDRLLPFVPLEDFIAIHKLAKCLNIAGCTKVRTVSTNVFDPGAAAARGSNTVFVCLPRNKHAQVDLQRHKRARSGVRFDLCRDGHARVTRVSIMWLKRDGAQVEIQSPQWRYLQMQRSEGGEWRRDPGRCVSVDFAVLGLLPDRIAIQQADGRMRWTLFLFGLRGLGTWGAAWYLDHNWEELVLGQGASEGVYQALLKVTYANHRVIDVVDVSDREEEFFRGELSDDTIRCTIDSHS